MLSTYELGWTGRWRGDGTPKVIKHPLYHPFLMMLMMFNYINELVF
jgi:hypothetical protein